MCMHTAHRSIYNVSFTLISVTIYTAIVATYFPNGEIHGDNPAYGIPDNTLERTTSTKLANTSTMRSTMTDHEFENTLYTSVQSAEINNPDYGGAGFDLTRISDYKKN